MAEPPSIVDGPKLEVRRAIEYDMPCPKCRKDIRVTQIEAGAVIKCPHPKCNNVTWRPEYVPPWWAKTSKFVLSLIGSFVLGVSTSLVASILYEKYTKPSAPITEPNPVKSITK